MRFKGEKCPVCENIFSETDDVVVCPECGTPHHRSCYAVKNECANMILHGVQSFEWKSTPPPEETHAETHGNAHGESHAENAANFTGAANAKETEDDFEKPVLFGVSKAELSAFMLLEPGSKAYIDKIERFKVINLNIFAGLLSPFYQFYKGMRLFGIAAIMRVLFPEVSLAVALIMLLFNDYIYLRHAASKIKTIRRYYSNLPEEYQSEAEYYAVLRVKGTPSVLRGVIEPIIVSSILLWALPLFGGA